MLRMVDFECGRCSSIFEEIVNADKQEAYHCGVKAKKVWIKAPGLGGSIHPHYSHAIGRKVNSYAEVDRELAKTGSWVATKSEANRMYDTDHFDDNVAIKKRKKEEIRKHVEKATQRAVGDGLVSFKD